MVAQEQELWAEAANYYLQAIQIAAKFQDDYRIKTRTENLARVWQAAQSSPAFDKKDILKRLAASLNITPNQAQSLLEQTNNDGS
jgi:hypothetical protein